MLESVQKALKHLHGSFINHNNEIILIPKFNVYTLLDDVETDDDFKVKLCEWFSRDCCCALRYSQNKRLERYYQENTDAVTDDAKANRKKFNLIQDQIIHFVQITLTFLFLVIGF